MIHNSVNTEFNGIQNIESSLCCITLTCIINDQWRGSSPQLTVAPGQHSFQLLTVRC